MSLHVFGAIVTAPGIAANNRGETEGNISTLQKLLWKGEVHTTVSAEALRWAVRYYWQVHGIPVNRVWNDEKEDYEWQDPAWKAWGDSEGAQDSQTFIDDDVLGFMRAEAAGKEAGDHADVLREELERLKYEYSLRSPAEKKTEEGKQIKHRIDELNRQIKSLSKGTCDKRRGVLEIARALSTRPFAGDITFNAKAGAKDRTSVYGTEMHATRYQYGFAFTPERLRERARALNIIDALTNLGEVAGNHSRFLFDFSPESVVFRVTSDPAPRLLYCFVESEDGTISAPELLRRVSSGDIAAEELFIGGPLSARADIGRLAEAGSTIFPGVKAAADACKQAMARKLGLA